ncbi:MAG: S9 family peptidase [Rhizobiales bacterium]|nr:S9 family peptidase [Hyphomicrobiales bacterium]
MKVKFVQRLVTTLVFLALLAVQAAARDQDQASTRGATANPSPPVARIAPKIFKEHGRRRIDNYDWLRRGDDPAVLAHLKAENAYAVARLNSIQPLIDELDKELHQRADGASLSPDFHFAGYVYQRRIAEGARFPTIVRHRPVPGASEQIVLDIERLAAGHAQYDLAQYFVSPDGDLVGFTVDFTGGRLHRIFVRNIVSGEVTDTGIKDADSNLVFSSDSKWLFYIRMEPKTLRSYQLWRHKLGTHASRDKLVYEENDPTFELSLGSSKSTRYILLKAEHQQTSEIRYLRADQPSGELKIIEPRRQGMHYDADHIGDTFYIRTNLNAPDFRMVRAPETAPHAANWIDTINETPGRLIADFEIFDTFIALVEEHDALQSVRVFRFADMRESTVPMPVDIGVAEINFAQGAANREASASVLQLRVSGPLHPDAVYDFDTRTGQLALSKQSRDWRWFDPQAYEAKRIAAPAPDGDSIPVTLMYRKDMLRAGGNPTLVTGYGAYGSSLQPEFPDSWVSLVDRGFVLAQAHVRGGQEMGRRWHDQGRMQHKHNSFTDFIAATEALIARGHADPRRIFAHGASAGGLLVAAVANLRPDLYAGIVAEVPFVDVITTMSDPAAPLTTLEYEEWGNPAIKEQYDNMIDYSPYDNVTPKAYPAMFVTAAMNDSQVGFHEPAKWVARLRATKTDGNELLFMTDMAGGHTGTSGRFGSTGEEARIIAWLIAHAQ